MVAILCESVSLTVIAFVMLAGAIWMPQVDAIANVDANPIVRVRFSIDGTNVSKEVINHVHQEHEQTIGNVHVLTQINIANLITILNTSASTTHPPSDATTNPGLAMKNINSDQNEIASNDEREQFRRLERTNNGVNYKPFKFPDRILLENSRRVRWPSETERHSNHAIDDEPKAVNSRPTVIFSRSEPKSQNDLTMTENVQREPLASIDWQSNGTNENSANPSVQILNSINITNFIVNQTAIESSLEPLIYIDGDGIFQVKYVHKGENVSIPNGGNEQQHSNEPSSATINETEATAINSNDNQQIPSDHHTSNTEHLATATATASTPTIDLIHDANASVDADGINNTEMIFQWNQPHTNAPSPSPSTKPQIQHHTTMSDNEPPRLFHGRPIFA